MQRWTVLTLVLLVPLAATAAQDAYPKTILAEDATATWCGYCPQAYQGLDVVHGVYDASEFLSARYYSSSSGGGLATPETDAAIAYYGVTGYPTVIFNGTTHIVGGGAAIATGLPYLSVVESSYFNLAPIRVQVDSFDPVTGAISATVTMYSTTDALSGDAIRFVLLEDDVTYQTETYIHVTRDIISDTITLAGVGSSQSFNQTFTINPSWITANLHAVVFVQRTASKEVVQAASSRSVPDYRVRAMVPFNKMQIGPSTGTYTSGLFTVMNVGLDDTFTISLVVDQAPAGWMAAYCDEGGACHVDPWEFSLTAQSSMDFYADVMPTSPGMMIYHFEVTSPNLASPLVIPFRYFTDNLDVLLVDDDGGESYEGYFTAALDAAGRSYGVWELGKDKLTAQALQTFKTIVWSTGVGYPTLDATDRTFLRDFLDAGGALFLTGQDIGWDLMASGDNEDPTFFHTYLHANYIRDDTNIYYLNGVAGDPISDGMVLHIAGGDGANNEAYPSQISAYDANATLIFNYQGDGGGAIRATHGSACARIVYLAFGFEAIDNPTDRAALMSAVLNWFREVIFCDGVESGDTSLWAEAVP